MEAQPSPLSSRAKPRDLQFNGPLLEMCFVGSKPNSERSADAQPKRLPRLPEMQQRVISSNRLVVRVIARTARREHASRNQTLSLNILKQPGNVVRVIEPHRRVHNR